MTTTNITIVLTPERGSEVAWEIFSDDADDAIAQGIVDEPNDGWNVSLATALEQAGRNFNADTIVNVVAADDDLYCAALGSFVKTYIVEARNFDNERIEDFVHAFSEDEARRVFAASVDETHVIDDVYEEQANPAPSVDIELVVAQNSAANPDGVSIESLESLYGVTRAQLQPLLDSSRLVERNGRVRRATIDDNALEYALELSSVTAKRSTLEGPAMLGRMFERWGEDEFNAAVDKQLAKPAVELEWPVGTPCRLESSLNWKKKPTHKVVGYTKAGRVRIQSIHNGRVTTSVAYKLRKVDVAAPKPKPEPASRAADKHGWECTACGSITIEFANTRMQACLGCGNTSWKAKRIEIFIPKRSDFETQYPNRR